MKYNVLWTPELFDYYKFGSKIYYKKNNQVIFENELLTPGKEIITWKSNPFYQGNRTFLQLPLLKRGTMYNLKINVQSVPENSFFVTISFYDRFGKSVGFRSFKSATNEFEYPVEAYSYEINLVNMGSKKVIFKKIIITSKESVK